MKKAAWFGALFSLWSQLPACTQAQNDCDRNPELGCFAGNAGGGTTMSGGPCAVPTDCPVPADRCKERTCEGGTCGTKDKDCGTLTCDPTSGSCAGCDDNDPRKKCPPKDCHDVACENGLCKETPNGTLTCDGGNGTCDDKGNCGTCTDGVQDGDEAGVDCGPSTPCGQCSGAACVSAVECKSGFCADGVCCDTPCDGLCQACDQGGKVGTCTPLPVGALDDLGNEACGAAEGGCGETLGYCRCDDGVKNGDETDVDCGGACAKTCGIGRSCASSDDCISGYCTDGYCCNASCAGECVACDLPGVEGLCSPVDPDTPVPECAAGQTCGGFGTCAIPAGAACATDAECASNNCSASTCTSCNQDLDCGATQVCEKGACFNKAAQGQPCPSTQACKDGFTCVDGVCCDTPCDGLCMGCHPAYTAQPSGTCAPILTGYDPHDECPQPDPSQPGPGGSAYCSGAPADMNGNSSCAQPQP